MKNSQNPNRVSRKPARSSIGMAVVATLLASGAQAADTSFNFSGDATANAHQTQNVLLNNTGAVRATLQNGVGNIGANGAQTANSTFLTGNTMGASATGNLANPVLIDLSLISDTAGGNPGLASLLVSTNTGFISSLVENNELSIVLTGFESGSAANKDNTISASTVVNQGVSSIAGSVPNGYVSVTPGSTSISSFIGPIESAAVGSVVVTTAQQTSGVRSEAEALSNQVYLELAADNALAIEAGAAVTGNRISASTKNNSSASTINIQAGGAPTFAGSAVVSNTQLSQDAGASAVNANSTIGANVESADEATELGVSLAVTGNTISGTAMGNEALGSGLSPVGNRILLADGMSFAGAGSGTPGATLNGYATGSEASADLLISSTQSNNSVAEPSLIGSTVSTGVVFTQADSLVNGSIDLSSNAITSNATGNAARSALASGAGAASFAGSVALVNQQDNNNTSIEATNTVATVDSYVEEAVNSSIDVSANRTSASARGNEVGQSLSLNATTLALGDTVELNSAPTLLQASGVATVSNRQVNVGAPVESSNISSSIGQRAPLVVGSTLTVDGNSQDSVALANNGSNQLTLTGTTVGSGAGILSLQRVDAEDSDADVPASSVTATLDSARVSLEVGTLINGATGSTLALTNNLQEAIGYGNLINNALSVTGTTLAAPSTIGEASTVGVDLDAEKALQGNVVAAYGVLSDQSVRSDVSARAITGAASADVLVNGPLNDSSVVNSSNTLAAEAYGNFGQNGLMLNATNLDSVDFSSVANLTSLQAVDAAISAQAATGAVALTTITGDVGSVSSVSSVSTSGNRIDAQASGSRVTNTVDVNATNIATVSDALLGSSVDGSATTNASFSLQNVQAGQGSVTASLRDADNVLLPSDVRTAITGSVIASSVVSDANTARASATSNNATNALALDGLGNLATSSALQNLQLTSAGVYSMVGQAGTPGNPAVPEGDYTAGATATPVSSSAVNYNAGTGSFSVNPGTTVVFSTADAGADKAALENYLSSLGFVVDSAAGTASVLGGTTVDLSSLNNVNQGVSGGNSTFSFSGFTSDGVAATAGVPNLGGVNMTVGGSVIDSALSVSGNTTYGLTRGNTASNTTAVKGNAVVSGGSSVRASVPSDFLDSGILTIADHTLSNIQQVVGTNEIASDVYGSFFIDAQPDAAIVGSTLSVSGNTQMAEARANTAANSLALEGTQVTAVSALQSSQFSAAAVNASSNLNVFAPAAVTDSTVLLSNNSNIALGVINDATNTVVVKGSQVGTGQAGDISVGGTFGDSIEAEQVLSNLQLAVTSVSSSATTTLNNQEALASDTGGALRSTLSIVDNTTAAEATANQAINSASVAGTASQAASVALRNIQESEAGVTATATSAARVALAPLAQSAALNSSVAVSGNSTTALARGNTASNVLNSSAGSAYGSATGGSVQAGDALTGFAVSANAGILNSQSNTGPVSASATGVSYQVALNSGGTAASGSSVGVSANQVAAQAYGNNAVNQLTLNALNTGTPTSAVGNYQRNSGAITASATGVTFGAGITGLMSGNSVNVSGNQVSATAVGNSVASSIMAAPR